MRTRLVVVLGAVALAPWLACGGDQAVSPSETTGSNGDGASTSSGAEGTPPGQGQSGDTSGDQTAVVPPNSGASTGGDGTSGLGGATSDSASENASTGNGISGTGSDVGTSQGGADSTGGGPTDTSSENSSGNPPTGAYEPCSGGALPPIDLEPFIVSPQVNKAIHMVNPPGQPNMFYVAERAGALKRFDMSQANPAATTLVTLSGVSTSGEYGLLSVALHPNFDGESEKRAYLVYTPTGSFIVQEFSIDGDVATEGRIIFEFSGDSQTNHNGGLAMFGPQGYLYVGVGDGGGGNDQHGDNGNGQNVNTTYGKLLRLDIEDPEQPVTGNLSSDDVDGAPVDGRILHYGLRNPWRFSFDRLTEDLYIGDVGQDTREEVDMIPAGVGPTNFGWAAREGFGECPGCGAQVFGLAALDPIYDYANPPGNAENSRSVTGGFVYRGNKIPGLYGRYVFGDYQTHELTVLTADGEGGACDVLEGGIVQNQLRDIASFAEDAEGELYVIGLDDGIYKFVPQP